MEETKIFNLFTFPEICKQCQEQYKPNIQFEVIPINDGFIEYYYLYDDIKTNILQRLYLLRYFKILFHNHMDYQGNIILIINKYNIQEFANALKYILPFQKITILSLIRINLDVLMSFL